MQFTPSLSDQGSMRPAATVQITLQGAHQNDVISQASCPVRLACSLLHGPPRLSYPVSTYRLEVSTRCPAPLPASQAASARPKPPRPPVMM